MKKNKIIFGAIIILVILGIGLYFFMLKNPSANNNNTSDLLVNNTLEYSVEITGYKFTPALISITNGSTVIWKNNDPVVHTITSDSGTELASPIIGTNNSYSHKFTTKGIFDYHCSIHPSMKGEIVVN
jgi:plastocyanin